MKRKTILLIFATLLILVGVTIAIAAPPLKGAIFTTTEDGSIVNENVRYEAKEDVYLDGGPGPNAPPTAAGLPEGDYYFQVTDPSGKDLLSTDHISCRKVHVNEFGVIDFVYSGTNYIKYKGDWIPVPCQHNQGIDVDHSELGAITVQLYPYDDTPNKGGVYKAWMTPVENYAGDEDLTCSGKGPCNVNGENYEPGNYHGFIPAASKTDNYKVKARFIPPEITVRKFHDKNANGIWDAEDEEVTGWLVDYTDPNGLPDFLYTPETILAAVKGVYTFVEDQPAGTQQTASYLDGVATVPFPSQTVVVYVEGKNKETHEVIYGNVGLGEVTACKVYDRNGNGVVDDGEPGIAGWKMQLWGGGFMIAEGFTGAEGCVTFSGLLPGVYTVVEIMPIGDWVATGPTSQTFTIVSSLDGYEPGVNQFTATFTNYCRKYADFDTKGYWHNKNGLAELTEDDRDYVNGLPPYSSPSSYFGAGDEPFDGLFSDGTPVAAAFNNDGSPIWGAGTWQAEVSHFLVDANAGGDPREQLAQQLLAFIFNSRHRLDDPGAVIELPGGGTDTAANIIQEAIDAWNSTDAGWQNDMQELLNALNEDDSVPYIPFNPCPVVYPPPV